MGGCRGHEANTGASSRPARGGTKGGGCREAGPEQPLARGQKAARDGAEAGPDWVTAAGGASCGEGQADEGPMEAGGWTRPVAGW